jgi:hypothetical protein
MMFSQQRARTRQPFGRSGILLTVSLIATLFISSPSMRRSKSPTTASGNQLRLIGRK